MNKNSLNRKFVFVRAEPGGGGGGGEFVLGWYHDIKKFKHFYDLSEQKCIIIIIIIIIIIYFDN